MTLQLRDQKVTLLESPGKVFFFLPPFVGDWIRESPIKFRFRNYIGKFAQINLKVSPRKDPPQTNQSHIEIMSRKRLITDKRFSKHFHIKTNHQVSLVKLLHMEVVIFVEDISNGRSQIRVFFCPAGPLRMEGLDLRHVCRI